MVDRIKVGDRKVQDITLGKEGDEDTRSIVGMMRELETCAVEQYGYVPVWVHDFILDALGKAMGLDD